MSKLTVFLRRLLPVKFAADAEKVAPEIQKQIDQLVSAASAEVARLRAQHSVQTLNDAVDKDLADLDAFYERVKKAILDANTAKVGAANAVLPPVNRWVVPPVS